MRNTYLSDSTTSVGGCPAFDVGKSSRKPFSSKPPSGQNSSTLIIRCSAIDIRVDVGVVGNSIASWASFLPNKLAMKPVECGLMSDELNDFRTTPMLFVDDDEAVDGVGVTAVDCCCWCCRKVGSFVMFNWPGMTIGWPPPIIMLFVGRKSPTGVAAVFGEEIAELLAE